MITDHSPTPSLLDHLTDQTPAHRDRAIDLLRLLSIGVVLLWHCTFSITHWSNGRLTMPNPVDDLAGLWTLTWVLQVMPLFFIVGGFANAAGFRSHTARGGRDQAFIRGRLDRLTRPLVALLLVWAVIDVVTLSTGITSSSVWVWGDVVFVPLWFIGVYGLVTALSPLTVRLDNRWGARLIGGLLTAVLVLDVIRFQLDVAPAGWANSLLVFLFAHQFGHRWHALGPDLSRRWSWNAFGGGIALLTTLVLVGPYPSSMVATSDSDLSNMFPTTAAIAALAIVQFGLASLLAPRLRRLAERQSVWRVTVAASSVAMTVFTWHMTALVLVVIAWNAVGLDLSPEATSIWWAQRPLFVVLPLVVLCPFVALFRGLERNRPAG